MPFPPLGLSVMNEVSKALVTSSTWLRVSYLTRSTGFGAGGCFPTIVSAGASAEGHTIPAKVIRKTVCCWITACTMLRSVVAGNVLQGVRPIWIEALLRAEGDGDAGKKD